MCRENMAHVASKAGKSWLLHTHLITSMFLSFACQAHADEARAPLLPFLKYTLLQYAKPRALAPCISHQTAPSHY